MGGRPPKCGRGFSPLALGMLAFVLGIFTAMILPVTLLAVIEGGLIIVLGIITLRR